ncbi:MAG: DUF5689 domain-containing protein [Candidatus Coprenecus sp.]|nr:DUF5689 domain-containing protein [Candidatus Coprenecus sp.]
MLKKLLISALIAASAIFATSCKKDDGQIVPVDITVSAEEVIIDSIPAGPVQITLKSNRPWSVDIQVENPWGDENANWITVDPIEGGQTEGQVITLTAQKNVTDSINYERAVRVYFRTDKQIFASVRVYQKGVTKPNAWVYKSVKELRDIAKDLDRNSTDAIDIKEPWIVKGIVISSGSNPQTVSNKNLFIQDETAGILLYTDAYSNFAFGDEVEVKLKGGNIKYYHQFLQFTPENTAMVSGTGLKEEPKATLVENGEDFVKGTFESMYVKMTAQVVSSDLEKTMADSPVIETEDGASFLMYTRSEGPSWSTQKVPQGAGTVYGLCTSYSGVYQLVPQREKDFAEMTGARFTGKPAVSTGEAQLSDDMESALLSGSFVYEGEVSDITEVGFYWKKSEDEEYTELKADAVSESFTATLTGLEKGTSYSFKAYVKIGERCYEGSEKLFITSDETILTVAQFVEVLKTLESGSSLINVGTYVEGIVVGDGDGGNLNKALAVADASGEANSGMYIYDKDGAFVNDFNIGDKVRIRLAGAKLDIYNELREIVWDSYSDDIELISSGNSFTIPQITAAQFNSGDYQAMRVEVINLQSKNGPGAVWNDGTNNNVNTIFADDSGEEIAVRTYKGVSWASNAIPEDVIGGIIGVASCYGDTQQLFPVVESDIAAFTSVVNFKSFEVSASEDLANINFAIEYTVNEKEVSAAYIRAKKEGSSESQNFAINPIESPISYSIDIAQFERGVNYEFTAVLVVDSKEYTQSTVFFIPALAETTITVKELVEFLLTAESGTSLAGVATYVEGIVVGDGDEGNLNKALAVADASGEANSGMYIYDKSGAFVNNFNIGDKVRIRLAGAKLDIFNELREIVWDSYSDDIELISSGNSFTIPQITAAQFNSGDYQAMRVEVINLQSKNGLGAVWNDGSSNNVNTYFEDIFTKEEVIVRTYKGVSWAKSVIGHLNIAAISGVASCYGTTQQLFPVVESDIAAFDVPITFNTFEISLSEDNSTVDFLLEYELKPSAELSTVVLLGESDEGVLELYMTAGSPITYSIDINELQRGTTYNFYFAFFIDGQTYTTEGKSFFVPELEETTITVKELVTRLLDTEDGASLASVATYVEGYVAGYNQDQNLFKCLAVVDNTGEEYSGVMLYGQNEFNSDFKIGDKVKISLAKAYYSPYNGLRQVRFTSYEKGVDIEVIESGATIQDVNISAAEFLTGAHQAMRVSVSGITAKADYVSKQWLNKPLFTDGSNEFYVETYKTSSWAEEYISDATGTVRGIHYGTSLKPQTKSDIDEALFGSAPSDVITPVPLPADFDPTTANFNIVSAMSAGSSNKAQANTGDINGSETITILKLDPRSAAAYLEAPVPAGVAGATKLSMVAVSWNGDSAEIIVTIKNGGTINGQESVSFTAPSNDGASFSAPFHLTLTEYYEFTLDGITDESVIRIEAKAKRALVSAVNFE